MSRWRRFSDWWWGVPSPGEYDEYGTHIFFPVDRAVHEKVWSFVRPAFTAPLKFLLFAITTIFVSVVGWAIFVLLHSLTGLS